ncbi:MAG: septum formation initiator family protein [Ktedonobacteraceae bacterium]|nr:septum formation initiator family protein [Ktedonobacteraceae bacterium]
MSSLKDRNITLQKASSRPIRAAKRRRQLHLFFFSLGPVTLCSISVLLIALMAILYVSQVGQAVASNQKIQQMHAQQMQLQRQNQDLQNSIATEQSPEYIANQAKQQGLVPADAHAVQVLVVPHLHHIAQPDENVQP